MQADLYPIAWKDGKYCNRHELVLDIQDYGILHADGVYDAVYIIGNKAFMLEESWNRLLLGASLFRFTISLTLQDFKTIVKEILSKSPRLHNACVATIVVTRGIPQVMGELHTCIPSMCVFLRPVPIKFPQGTARAYLSKNHYRVPDKCIDQRFKHFAWADLTMAQFEAIDNGFDLGIISSTDGYISEGFATGICCYKGKMITSPASNRIMSTTIVALSKAAKKQGWSFHYTDITENDLLAADGVVACTIAGLCTRISQFNDHVFNPEHDMKDKFNSWIMSDSDFFTDLE